jgi:hypothetical protein
VAHELPRHRCPRREALGEVSAEPDASHWQEIAAIPLVDNGSGGSPRQATEFRAVHDARELRVLFRAVDSRPWATLSERDGPLHTEEVFEVFLDPVGDLEGYFEFEVNPLNAVLDLVLRRTRSGYRKDFQWRCEDFRSAVRRDDTGWSAEFAIPFRSLGNAAPRGTWRANFYRIDRPENAPWELSAWSPTGMEQFHVPQRFGFLEFADD